MDQTTLIRMSQARTSHSKTRLISLLLSSALVTCILAGCSTVPANEPLQMNGMYFDTVVQIEAWGTTQDVMDQCREMCEYYENLLSTDIDTSDVSKINRAGGAPVTVSEETAELIEKGIEYGDLSGGLFDITIASASDLWDFKDNEEKILPSGEALEEAAAHIDYRCVTVDGCTVTLADPEAQIDLGGIAKGYIADRIKEFLTDEGVSHALIDLGGNMLAVGGRYDGNDYRIGLQKPFAQTGTVMAALAISDQSVVTSGDYERYFEKDGIIYHHILDPATGYPVQNSLDQVTIISDHSVDGDALSTTCYALGLEDGLALVRSLDGVEAVFVTKDGEMHKSSDDIRLELIEND